MTRPPYVEHGGLISLPAPFVSRNTKLSAWVAKADKRLLADLCRKVFADVTGGAIDYRPVGRHVLVTWGWIDEVRPIDPPHSDWGGVQESQVAIWMPLWSQKRERFAMWVPYMWLDNPMSIATGREVLGFAKTWGWPEFPPAGADDPVWSLDAFALDYHKNEQASRRPLLRMERIGLLESAPSEAGALHDVARQIARLIREEEPVAEGIGANALADLTQRRLPTVFLKQFRAEDGHAACLQQVVELDYTVTRSETKWVPHRHRLTVRDYDSQPLTRELGLESQDVNLALYTEMDFDVGGARVVWST